MSLTGQEHFYAKNYVQTFQSFMGLSAWKQNFDTSIPHMIILYDIQNALIGHNLWDFWRQYTEPTIRNYTTGDWIGTFRFFRIAQFENRRTTASALGAFPDIGSQLNAYPSDQQHDFVYRASAPHENDMMPQGVNANKIRRAAPGVAAANNDYGWDTTDSILTTSMYSGRGSAYLEFSPTDAVNYVEFKPFAHPERAITNGETVDIYAIVHNLQSDIQLSYGTDSDTVLRIDQKTWNNSLTGSAYLNQGWQQLHLRVPFNSAHNIRITAINNGNVSMSQKTWISFISCEKTF
jgi:hypothetical protein